jgi:hypothetical protein
MVEHQYPIGGIVKLRENNDGRYAFIRIRYSDIDGGVIVEPELGGFRSWNESDLELIAPEAIVELLNT